MLLAQSYGSREVGSAISSAVTLFLLSSVIIPLFFNDPAIYARPIFFPHIPAEIKVFSHSLSSNFEVMRGEEVSPTVTAGNVTIRHCSVNMPCAHFCKLNVHHSASP
jgi:hypothetical protein